jgi:hypothetical protein
MSLTLNTSLGFTEAIIDDGSLRSFYQIAGILSEDPRVTFTRKQDDVDEINWSFEYNRHKLNLHYNIYDGISVYPAKTTDARRKDNAAVAEVAKKLEVKLKAIPYPWSHPQPLKGSASAASSLEHT